MERSRPIGWRRLAIAVSLAGLVLAFLLLRFLPMRRPPPAAPPAPTAPVTAPVPETGKPDRILVDDFETGQTQGIFGERKNRLDAFQGTWARRPSYTVITKELDTRPGSVGYALRLDYSKSGGWCGWYTLLNGIDVSRHNALTFWVKGAKGGERFDIGLADDTMQNLEIDAVYVGSIVGFLPHGVTTEWQQVKVPLQGLRSELNLARMGSLVLWFRYEGAGSIQIDDVAFAYDEEVERIQKENAPRAQKNEKAPRSLWVWKTDPISGRPEARKELLEFCERAAIQTFYIYLGEEPISKSSAEDQKKLAQFLRECHEKGIKVHALQGNPLWALKRSHPMVLTWISGFLEFNKNRPPEERIDGVHMDIEPYLTQEWETGDREKLKAEFLELLTACRRLIDQEAIKPFVMGLAIPIFYSREPEMEEQLLKNLDYAALMDYYDSARDIIENARFHLGLAQKLGVQMVLGVETQDLVQMNQGKRRNTFVEEGWEEMERELKKVAVAFAGRPSFGGIAIHYYDSYRLLQRGRNVPTRERSGKVPTLSARARTRPVRVDGDLSDWSGASWYDVNERSQVVYGVGAWGWGQDMSFKAAVEWEPNALLLAVDVTDNLLVQEKRGADMWEGDHLELWLDTNLEDDFNEAVNSDDDFQIGLSPGNFKDLPPEAYVWVPSVDAATLKSVEIAARPKPDGKGYTLEARLPTAFLFQNVTPRVGVDPGAMAVPKRITPAQFALQNGVLSSRKLKPGFRMGIMIDGSDCDAAQQPQKCLLSTSPERQWGDPTTFNILELKE